MQRYFGFILLALGLSAGCGGGGGGSAKSSVAAQLVGSWRLTRIVGSQGPLSLTLSCPGSAELPGVGSATCGDQERIDFRADGTFTASGALSVSAPGLPIPTLPTNTSGTWSLVNETLTLTPTGAALGVSATVALSGNTATVTQTQTTGTATVTGVGTLVRQ